MFSDVADGLVSMTDDDVLSRFRMLELRRRELEAEQALLVSVMDARSIAQQDGHRTINGLLRAELNCSTSDAAAMRSFGRTVNQFDEVGEAWMAGRIGRSQVKHIGRARGNDRIVDRLDPFASILVEQAKLLDAPDFAELVDEIIRRLDEDGSHEARDEAIEHRNAHVSAVGDAAALRATGGAPLEAAAMVEIFDAFVEAEFDKDVADRKERHGDNAELPDLARTDRQRRFDALLAIFRAAAASDGSKLASGLVLNIVVDAKSYAEISHAAGLATDVDLHGVAVDPFTGLARPDTLIDELLNDPAKLLERRCETDGGIKVHAHDVLQAALSGHVRRVVIDSDGVVVDMGRKQRLFTDSPRVAAKLLAKRCEHPGCLLPARFCDVDHGDEWDRHGGATDQANGHVRCNPHNRAKTKRGWRTKRATNGKSYTIREDGTIMVPIGARQPSFGDDESASRDMIDRRVDDITWDQLVTRVKQHTVEHLVAQRRRR